MNEEIKEQTSHKEVEGKPSPYFYPYVDPLWSGQTPAAPGAGKFAPDDIMDGRPVGEWRTRYPRSLHRLIQWEAVYLAGLGLAFIGVGAWFWVVRNGFLNGYSGLLPALSKPICNGGLAFAGGLLGGTLFGLKWLYHSVAKGLWSIDRRLWRLFTPWNSGVLAIAFVALVNADFFRLLNRAVLERPSGVFGLSFLVGYFSDLSIGKLNEMAQVLFGLQLLGKKTATLEEKNDTAGTKPTSEGVGS